MGYKENSKDKFSKVSDTRIVIKQKFNSASKEISKTSSKPTSKTAVKIHHNSLYTNFITSFRNLEHATRKLAEKNNISVSHKKNNLTIYVPFRELIRKLYRRKVIDIVFVTKVKVLRDLLNCCSAGKEAKIDIELINGMDDMVAKAKSLLID